MKKMNRIFFQILVLVLMMTSAMSNAFAQGGFCIRAYMLEEESCSPGHDGSATVFIPTSLSGKCSIEWRLRDGSTSSSETISGLDHGIYYVTVRSTTCSNVIFYQGTVSVTQEEECAIKVNITGPTDKTGDCNGIPATTFTASASGGVPPYTFSGWSQAGGASATKTVNLSEGHNSITCSVTDSEGNYGTASLDVFAKKEECAQDPNEIKGPAGYSVEHRYVNTTDKMNYTIGFENDPEFAMAPASYVKITYDVTDKQKLASFRLADFGFGSFVFTVPSNVSSYSQRLDVSDSLGVWVDVNAGIDIVHNQLFWIFQSIDPATGAEPASSQMGFLPINDSLEHGQGYVSFYIAPANNVVTGDTIGADAVIVFDDNAPIGTNVWINTFDAVAPTSTLHANMNATDSLYCTFSFEAQDDANGSGVRGVEVYMSVNNADYFPIGNVHPDSTLSYALENGVYYQFMSIATDNVGNKEAFKAKADTSVNFNTAPIDLVLDGNTFYEYDPTNTQIGTLFTLDNDVNLPFVYELVNGEGDDDNALFTIDGSVLRTDTTFVCSRQTTFSVRIRTTDIGGLFYEKSFNLNEIIQHETVITRMNKALCQGSSIDFNGRELVEAGTYADTMTTVEGCDSIVVWYVKENPSYNITLDTTVCDEFVWNDSSYTQSGLISYTYTLATGCDSTVNYNLTVNHSVTDTVEIIACDSLTWIDGITYYESTNAPTYMYAGGAANGCDSTVTLHLTVNYSNTGDTTAIACDSFDWYEHLGITESCDNLMHTFTNAVGCDSVVTLHLTVNHSNTGDTIAVACESFDWYEHVGITQSCDNLTHTFTNAVGCDSVVTLHLTINQPTTGIDEQVACETFTWIDDVTYTASTSTPTYTYVGGAANGCDSTVTLHLTINQPTTGIDEQVACESYTWIDGVTYTASTNTPTYTYVGGAANGCDSTVTLHLTINQPTTGIDEQVACETFTWIDGVIYTASTTTPTYTIEGGAANGCDSTVTLHLTVNYSNTGDTTAIACDSFDWYEHLGITESCDNLMHTFTNAVGCDSVVTLHLTVNHSNTGDTIAVVCESFDWYEHVGITQSCDNLTHTFTNAVGCDSVVTLHLTINQPVTEIAEVTACESYTWIDGVTYTASTSTPTYTYVGGAANGCDSTVTLHLTINQPTTGIDEQVACESYTWIDGVTYTASTNTPTYTYVGGAANGCDSTVTLHLTINQPTTGIDEQVACEPFTWIDGVTYTASTITPTYTIEGGAANGCDSTVTLHLTVNYSNTGDTTAIACDSFDWYEHLGITQSCDNLTHTFTNASGCDSVVTLHLTVNHSNTGDTTAVACESFDWYEHVGIMQSCDNLTHTFTNAVGCDSVVTLHLTINQPVTELVEVTACESYTWIDGVTYTASTSTPTYTYVGGAANGCDSTVTLHLTINQPTTGIDELVACEPFTWIDGVTYTASTSTPTYTYAGGAANGCDSTVTLHLTINQPTTGIDEQVACENFTWIDGVTYTASTNTPIFTIEDGAVNGCDSTVTLHLTINQPVTELVEVTACESYTWIDGVTYTASTSTPTYTYAGGAANGCDSTVTLHLTINQPTTGIDELVACEPFTWIDGVTYTASTNTPTYTYAAGAANGCDSTVTLHLTINQPVTELVEVTACESYTWIDGVTYTASTTTPTYTIEGGAANGCDSTVTLHLTVNYSSTGDTTAIACESFDWYEHLGITQSCDNLTHTFTNAVGCDSVVTLHLTVNHSNTGDTIAVACGSFDWYEHLGITQSCDNLTHTFTNAVGCDSVVTLHLTVNHSNTGDTIAVACESFDWYEHVGITQSCDNLTHAFTNTVGCDSVVTLHLTINQPTTGIDEQVACESYTWIDDVTYTASTNTPTYTIEGGAANGCDSTVTLHLTINQSTMGVDYQEACDSLQWIDGVTYYESTSDVNAPTFTLTNAAGCDSVVTLNLSLNHSVTVDYYLTISDDDLPFTYGDTTFLPGTVQSGDYTIVLETADGCDSVVTLHLTVTGINDYLMNVEMNVYPNPTNDKVNVQLSVNNAVLTSKAEIQLYDMYGKWLKTWKVTGETTVIDLSSYAASVYFVKAVDGQRMIGIRKVVKE